MNDSRRKAIKEIQEKIRLSFEALSNAKDELEAIRDDEQDYADNMPENMQSGERYAVAENAISELDDAISNLDDLTDEEIIEHLDCAISGC